MTDLALDLAGGSGGIAGVTSYFGLYAGLPAPGNAGRTAYITDAPVQVWVDDGIAWRPIIGGVICTAPPLAAGFTWINQGGASLTQLNGAITLVGVNDGASPGQLRALVLTNIAATAFSELGIAFNPIGDGTAGHTASAMVMLREGGTAKAYVLNTYQDFGNRRTAFELDIWTNNATRPTAVDKGYAVWDSNRPLFTRVRRSGANVVAEVSRDRQVWTVLDSRVTTTVFTTAPDQAGFGVDGVNVVPTFNVLHFINGS